MNTRKFSRRSEADEDPFLGFDLVGGARLDVPLLANTLAYFECGVVCHMDVEGDHDLFVGQIKSAGCSNGKPYIHLRDNGFEY